MAKIKFIRRDSGRFSKIGKNRKKLQKWRRPKGRDNKMREGRHGYPKVVSVGYKKARSEVGKIDGMKPIVVRNVSGLVGLNKNFLVIIGKVGTKKRLDIIKKAMELKLKMSNVKTAQEVTK